MIGTPALKTTPRRIPRVATASSSIIAGSPAAGNVSSVAPANKKIPKNKRPRSRNHTLANSMPAVHIKTHDMLNPQERRFLEAAEKGDRPTLIACLRQVKIFSTTLFFFLHFCVFIMWTFSCDIFLISFVRNNCSLINPTPAYFFFCKTPLR